MGTGLESATRLSPSRSSSQPAAKQETVQGQVLSTDPEKGTAQVQTSRGIVTVRGRPSDTAGMKAGDKTFLNVQKTGGELWVEQAAPSGFGSADVTQQPGMGAAASTVNSGAYQQRGRAGGVISEVDTKAGTFTVDGKTIAAHPSQLQGLKPGQQISVDYGVVGESGWAERIHTGGPAAAPRPAQEKPKPPPPDAQPAE